MSSLIIAIYNNLQATFTQLHTKAQSNHINYHKKSFHPLDSSAEIAFSM